MRLTQITPEYWEQFKQNARELDVLEVAIQHPTCPVQMWDYEIVEGSMVAVSDDGKTVYAVGGVERDISPCSVWMLCTNAVHDCPVEFLRFTKTIYQIWINGNGHMWNYVWLGNDLHVNWLKWLGAEFSHKVIINNEVFQKFDFYAKEG